MIARNGENNEREGRKKDKRSGRQKVQKRTLKVRLVPVWLRLLIVLFLFLASVITGLMLGYSVVGDGEGARILRWETWQELYHYISGGS
ncbi:DNA-directed RNA polymerase subunit beta [Salicibibacter halophilus]|uniref:DNA-directed RNA polymerase subunit beta n=1 Tax=Salicibibacter halophilus TaxID=2502791 RepID=A0A514LIW3_9BACI|nr:DNA-directed RNA polymerase subunit beta [Salicibibacter halophilus]QDI91783.1 DNA-directed RNA polymerase subunit beta [Salicibibacter halophilus]